MSLLVLSNSLPLIFYLSKSSLLILVVYDFIEFLDSYDLRESLAL